MSRRSEREYHKIFPVKTAIMSTITEEEKRLFDGILYSIQTMSDRVERRGSLEDPVHDQKLNDYIKEAMPDVEEKVKSVFNKLPQLLVSDEKRMFEETIDAFNSVLLTTRRGTNAEHTLAVSKYANLTALIERYGLGDKYVAYLKENGGEHRMCFQLPLIGTLRGETLELFSICDDCKSGKCKDVKPGKSKAKKSRRR